MSIRVGLVSLGCDKNRVDTEKIISKLKYAGYEIVIEPQDADYIIINTCAFIESATTESIDTIIEMATYKKSHNVRKIIVVGCLATRYYDELVEHLSEADMIIPLKDYDNIIELISDNSEAPATYNGITRELSTPYHYGYLKIADGCNNKCAYCAIPSIRGKYISEPKENVINEAKEIIGNYGIDELILVAQDVTRYGHDIYGEYALLNLLDDLEKLDLRWIRLMYCYPELITDDLIRRVSSSKKIASYLDIPMQHINDNILKTMNRRNNKEYAYNLIDRIKNIDDNISIRSTFICGLPNEGEAEHKELIKFLEYAKFDNCGFFAFSREKGTQAYNMPNQVKNEITLKRVEELYSIQSEIVQKKHSSMIGDNIELVYEGIDYEKQSLYGRTYRSAPDIDTIVLFTPKESPEIADFVKARITGIDNLDLVAELI